MLRWLVVKVKKDAEGGEIADDEDEEQFESKSTFRYLLTSVKARSSKDSLGSWAESQL